MKKKLDDMSIEEIEELQYKNAQHFLNFHIIARVIIGILITIGCVIFVISSL